MHSQSLNSYNVQHPRRQKLFGGKDEASQRTKSLQEQLDKANSILATTQKQAEQFNEERAELEERADLLGKSMLSNSRSRSCADKDSKHSPWMNSQLLSSHNLMHLHRQKIAGERARPVSEPRVYKGSFAKPTASLLPRRSKPDSLTRRWRNC